MLGTKSVKNHSSLKY